MTTFSFIDKEKSLRAAGDQPSARSDSIAIYIHIPFCHHRCSYCDFNIYAGMRSIYQPYADAIAQEMAATAQRVGRQRVHSIFFGGGTPSMFLIELIGGILASVRAFFDVVANPEITLEVNPTTGDRRRTTDGDSLTSISSGLWSAVRGQQEYFTQLRSLGFNRL